MDAIKITIETDVLKRRMTALEREQFPFANASALTKTGGLVKNVLTEQIPQTFQSPTPYTMKAVYLKPATKADPIAEVSLKGWAYKSAPAARWLAPSIFGGPRDVKRSEQWLRDKMLLPPGMFMLPAQGSNSGVQWDQYGNMSRGQLIRVLSALKALPEIGYLANRTKRSLERLEKQKRAHYYFVPKEGLPPGIYERLNSGVKMVLAFVKQPHYRKRWAFYETSHRGFKEWYGDYFHLELRKATGGR